MGAIDNLDANEMRELIKRVERIERGAPVGFSTVSRGQTEFIGTESLKVTGSQLVTGLLTITGTLKLVGAFLLEGITTITGDVTITGKLLINGLVELTKTLTVKSGGKIVVEGANTIELSQIAGAAQMQLGAAKLIGAADGFALGVGTRLVTAGPGGVALQGGANSVSVATASGSSVAGPLSVSGTATLSNLIANTTTGATYVVANASTGLLQRVSSASRFKLDQRTVDLPESLMSVRVKDWLDAGEVAIAFELNDAPRPWTQAQAQAFTGLGMRRVPGVVAEEVHAAGGELFTTFDSEGEIEGVAYDRLALARTQILGDQLAEAMRQIQALQDQLAAATSDSMIAPNVD